MATLSDQTSTSLRPQPSQSMVVTVNYSVSETKRIGIRKAAHQYAKDPEGQGSHVESCRAHHY